ncbi:MAG TPA: peptide deformylase [Limnochordia bacterium]|nr:peptide deformylase [Limnochordia bacterium]
MSVRRILSIFEPTDVPILRKRCKPVPDFGARTQRIVDDLLDTLAEHENSGAALAAPQIGEPWRIVVARLERAEKPVVLVNPKIVRDRGAETEFDGCLSIPGIYGDTARAERIHLDAFDRHGQRTPMALQGYDARVIQHELDHLDGVLFIDRLDDLGGLYKIAGAAEAGGARRAPVTERERALIEAQRRSLPPYALRGR